MDNVLVTVSDKKIGVNNGSGINGYYIAEVVTANDYYPFGMVMPGRKYDAGSQYRYGFNGKENDNEVKGERNQQDYGMRIYDPRLARFLSVDPITKDFPELSPYQFASNSPVECIDLDGLESLSSIKSGLTRQFEAQIKSTITPPKAIEIEIMVWNPYRNQAQIGKVSVVEGNIAAARNNYYNAVGDNIRGGFFGAAGYMLKGERGSFYGAAMDGVTMSFGGIPAGRSSVLPRINGISILSQGYKPANTTAAFTASEVNQTRVFEVSSMPNFRKVDKGGGNFFRVAELGGNIFEFNSSHSYNKEHTRPNSGGVKTKLDPNIASMDAVEYSIMSNINSLKANSNISIPEISNNSGKVEPYKGTTNVNGVTIKYNAVTSNGQIKISDYMIE